MPESVHFSAADILKMGATGQLSPFIRAQWSLVHDDPVVEATEWLAKVHHEEQRLAYRQRLLGLGAILIVAALALFLFGNLFAPEAPPIIGVSYAFIAVAVAYFVYVIILTIRDAGRMGALHKLARESFWAKYAQLLAFVGKDAAWGAQATVAEWHTTARAAIAQQARRVSEARDRGEPVMVGVLGPLLAPRPRVEVESNTLSEMTRTFFLFNLPDEAEEEAPLPT